VTQQTIRTERSRRQVITLGIWPTPFVASASSIRPGQSPGRAGNREPSAGRNPTDEQEFHGRVRPTANGGLPARWPRCARPPVSGETTADGQVRRRQRVVIAEPGTDHRRTVHRFPCRRRFHGPPIDIHGAARLGVRHTTADHPRELLPSTIAACSGVATFPRTCPVTTWFAETGHRPPGRAPVVVPPPVRAGKGQR